MKKLSVLLVGFILLALVPFADAQTAQKGLIGRQDLSNWDGKTSTFDRKNSTGGTTTLLRVGNEVDVLAAFGSSNTDLTGDCIDRALNSIGTTSKVGIVLAPGTWTIAANKDWSSYTNVTFRFVPGVLISHGAFTLNIPNVEAGAYQIFSGTGLITISGTSRGVYPEWWGIDGTADNVQIQAAIDCFGSTPGTINLPSANYNIAASLTKDSNAAANTVRRGYVFKGTSPFQTTLTWTGAADGTMLNLYGIQFSKFENFTLQGSASAGTGIKMDYHCYYNKFTSVNVIGAKYGVDIGSTDSTSSSENLFTDCNFLEASRGIILGGANALNNQFLNCNVSAMEYAAYVYPGGCEFNGGTYHLFDTWAWGTTPTATFYLPVGNDAPLTIRNVYDDSPNAGATTHAFLLTGTGTGRGVTLDNCIIRVGPVLPTNIIDYQLSGPLILIGNHVGRTNAGVAPSKVYIHPYNSGVTLTLIGNTFHTNTSADTLALRTDANWDEFLTLTGNVLLTALGNSWVSGETYTYPMQDITQGYSYITSFVASDATPSIRFGDTFKTANAAGTTITNFDDGFPGKKIIVLINDGNTTIQFRDAGHPAAPLMGNSGADWSPASGDWMECIYDGTSWHCSVHDCTS